MLALNTLMLLPMPLAMVFKDCVGKCRLQKLTESDHVIGHHASTMILLSFDNLRITYDILSMWMCATQHLKWLLYIPSIYMDIQVSYYWHPSCIVHVTPVVFWSSLANKLSAIWSVVCWIWVRFRLIWKHFGRFVGFPIVPQTICARSWCWQWFF